MQWAAAPGSPNSKPSSAWTRGFSATPGMYTHASLSPFVERSIATYMRGHGYHTWAFFPHSGEFYNARQRLRAVTASRINHRQYPTGSGRMDGVGPRCRREHSIGASVQAPPDPSSAMPCSSRITHPTIAHAPEDKGISCPLRRYEGLQRRTVHSDEYLRQARLHDRCRGKSLTDFPCRPSKRVPVGLSCCSCSATTSRTRSGVPGVFTTTIAPLRAINDRARRSSISCPRDRATHLQVLRSRHRLRRCCLR